MGLFDFLFGSDESSFNTEDFRSMSEDRRHRGAVFTCGAIGYLPPVVSPTLGESKFEYTSGGSCGRACNVPPIDWDIYLRCKNISYRARYRPLAKSERKAQGRKGHTKTAKVHGANGD